MGNRYQEILELQIHLSVPNVSAITLVVVVHVAKDDIVARHGGELRVGKQRWGVSSVTLQLTEEGEVKMVVNYTLTL